MIKKSLHAYNLNHNLSFNILKEMVDFTHRNMPNVRLTLISSTCVL